MKTVAQAEKRACKKHACHKGVLWKARRCAEVGARCLMSSSVRMLYASVNLVCLGRERCAWRTMSRGKVGRLLGSMRADGSDGISYFRERDEAARDSLVEHGPSNGPTITSDESTRIRNRGCAGGGRRGQAPSTASIMTRASWCLCTA